MRQIKFAIAIVLLAAGALSAQTRTDIEEVRETIGAQIEAFKADDMDAAFGFASPNIRRIFGTAERFGEMVTGGFPMVHRPAEVQFMDQAKQGNAVWQQVRIVDQAGQEHWFAYELLVVEGSWRINGVFPVEAPGLSA